MKRQTGVALAEPKWLLQNPHLYLDRCFFNNKFARNWQTSTAIDVMFRPRSRENRNAALRAREQRCVRKEIRNVDRHFVALVRSNEYVRRIINACLKSGE